MASFISHIRLMENGGGGGHCLYHHFTWDQVKMTSGGGRDSEQAEDGEEDRGKQTCMMRLLDFPAKCPC